MGTHAWQPFSVTVSTDGDRATVFLRGELDMSGVDRAREAIEQAEAQPSALLVLDLSQLDFTNDLSQIDTGVTSGADSNVWDEISVDEGKIDSCPDGAKGKSADATAPAVCKNSKN